MILVVLHLETEGETGGFMAVLSVSEAARTWRVGRSTLHRMIKEGRISATVQPDSSRGIDSAEMVRVFGEPRPETSPETEGAASEGVSETLGIQDMRQVETPLTVSLLQEQIAWLKVQLESAKVREDAAHERELWFRRQLEDVQRLLPAPAANPPPPRPAPVGKPRLWVLVILLLLALAFASRYFRDVITFPWPF